MGGWLDQHRAGLRVEFPGVGQQFLGGDSAGIRLRWMAIEYLPNPLGLL